MTTASMPYTDPALTDTALAWVHLPTGVAAIQGLIRDPDGGPVIAGPAHRHRPLHAGGTEVLLRPGPAPTGSEPFPHDRWALTDAGPVTVQLARQDWTVITRRAAVSLLAAQGYRLRPSTAGGHELHLDDADEMTWHPNRRRDPYLLKAFVIRPVQVPTNLADLRYPTVP